MNDRTTMANKGMALAPDTRATTGRQTDRWTQSRRRRAKRLAGLLLALAGAWAAVQLAGSAGWRINLTESEPLGLYRLFPVRGAIPHGAMMELCPPSWVTPSAFPFYMRGDCPNGGRPMLKTVVGVPGDVVTVTRSGVWINGHELPHSGQLSKSQLYTRTQLPHPTGTWRLRSGQYWAYGSGANARAAADSFDSRYWGPVDRGHIRAISPAR